MNKLALVVLAASTFTACGGQGGADTPATESAPSAPTLSPLPPLDANNIVSIAVASHDHTTLVTALRAADYVTGVANPGPLTVFAPTNAAFAALPAGTVDNLLKPENVDQLRHILQHHVVASVYDEASLHDGQSIGMTDGSHVIVHIHDGHIMVDDANITASIRASNGIVHVIDKVLLPPAAH